MKAAIFALLFTAALVGCTRANSVIVIDIMTTDTGVTYAINNQRKTPDEIEAWLREAMSAFGDREPVLVRPDDRTSFATVLSILRRFKTAGVKHFEIFTITDFGSGNRIQHSLSGDSDNIKTQQFTLPDAPPEAPK